LTKSEHRGHDVIDELLRQLDELRELDRRRNVHAPGSAAHDAAELEVDLRTRRLMDRFRDLKKRRGRTAELADADWTRPLDASDHLLRNRSSLLN
jgi:hypothetical protein